MACFTRRGKCGERERGKGEWWRLAPFIAAAAGERRGSGSRLECHATRGWGIWRLENFEVKYGFEGFDERNKFLHRNFFKFEVDFEWKLWEASMFEIQ
jgi:hypothetical protein